MPRDTGLHDDVVATTVEPPVDPLEAMGIIPVPLDFVRSYKARYKEKFLRNNHYSYGPYEWRSITFKDWIDWKHMTHVHQRQKIKRAQLTLEQFLAAPTKTRMTDDKTGAPEELVTLAMHVDRGLAIKEFSVDYFDIDPVLNVIYPFDGGLRTACLGVWNLGKIVRMAASIPAALPPPVGLLAGLRQGLARLRLI
jgi:hypothetical protein